MNKLITKTINSPLGDIVLVADENFLYFLEFYHDKIMDDMNLLESKLNLKISKGENSLLKTVEQQLNLYFKGKLSNFDIPTKTLGTDFQNKVWKELLNIKYGETISYKELAEKLGDKNKARAAGSANGKNLISIIIPCHRVISNDGGLGGYAGGLDRKKYLLNLEGKYIK